PECAGCLLLDTLFPAGLAGRWSRLCCRWSFPATWWCAGDFGLLLDIRFSLPPGRLWFTFPCALLTLARSIHMNSGDFSLSLPAELSRLPGSGSGPLLSFARFRLLLLAPFSILAK